MAWSCRSALTGHRSSLVGGTVASGAVSDVATNDAREEGKGEGRKKVWGTEGRGAGHGFRYAMPGVVVLDTGAPTAALPGGWWGGFVRSDHWGDPAVDLRTAVLQHLFGAERGAELGRVRGADAPYAVDLVTTLRAFGRAFNPISVFLVWSTGSREDLAAVLLEVSNYPWRERVLYAFRCSDGGGGGGGDDDDDVGGRRQADDAGSAVLPPGGANVAGWSPAVVKASAMGSRGSGKRLKISGKCAKTLHVSPFHAHPGQHAQHYEMNLTLGGVGALPAKKEGLSSAPTTPRPFESFNLVLNLRDGAVPALATPAVDDAAAGPGAGPSLYRADWVLSNVAPFQASVYWPNALLTEGRILFEAAKVATASGRTLYQNVTNPAAPIDTWAVAAAMLATAVSARALRWAGASSTLSALLALAWLALLFAGRALAEIPLARDAGLGSATAVILAALWA